MYLRYLVLMLEKKIIPQTKPWPQGLEKWSKNISITSLLVSTGPLTSNFAWCDYLIGRLGFE